MSHDPKCRELALRFLDDHAPFLENDAIDLAETIQRSVEDWLEDRFNSAPAAPQRPHHKDHTPSA